MDLGNLIMPSSSSGDVKRPVPDGGNLLLDLLKDRPVAYHPDVTRALGGNDRAALILLQAIYWTGVAIKMGRADGRFFKTAEQWEEETGLSRTKQESARRHLVERGLWTEERRGPRAIVWYTVDIDQFVSLMNNYYSRLAVTKRQKALHTPVLQISSSPNAEILESSEITTENIKESVVVYNTQKMANIFQKECSPANSTPTPTIVFIMPSDKQILTLQTRASLASGGKGLNLPTTVWVLQHYTNAQIDQALACMSAEYVAGRDPEPDTYLAAALRGKWKPRKDRRAPGGPAGTSPSTGEVYIIVSGRDALHVPCVSVTDVPVEYGSFNRFVPMEDAGKYIPDEILSAVFGRARITSHHRFMTMPESA